MIIVNSTSMLSIGLHEFEDGEGLTLMTPSHPTRFNEMKMFRPPILAHRRMLIDEFNADPLAPAATVPNESSGVHPIHQHFVTHEVRHGRRGVLHWMNIGLDSEVRFSGRNGWA